MLKKIWAGAAVFTAMMMFAGTALGETYYLDDGDVTVVQDGTGRYVNGSDTAETEETVITQRDAGTATANTVTLTGEDGNTVEVTLSGVNIEAPDAYVENHEEHDAESAVTVNGSAKVTVDGENTLTGGAGLDRLGDPAGGETGVGGAGIEVGEGDSITLDAKDDGASLTANGGEYAAGIGSVADEDAGTVTVDGGEVNANGGYGAAGIGGGQGGNGGTVTVNGGDVTATGGELGAGIGGGEQMSGEGANGGDVTVNGGTVNANGGYCGAGIGSGDNSNNYGSSVNTNADGGTLTVNGGDVTATGGYQGAGIGGGNHGDGAIVIIKDGRVYATTTVWEGYSCSAGIGGGSFGDGGTLTVYAGDVTAIGGMYSAGIGGGDDGIYGFGNGGTFIMYGGKVYAVGGTGGAGIGGAYAGRGGTVTVSGGELSAFGGMYAAALGGGYRGSGDTITLAGGVTLAVAGYGASALGGGYGGLGGDIVIYDGDPEAQTVLTAYALGNKWAIDVTGDTTGVENVINGRFRREVPGLDLVNKVQLTELEIVDADGNVVAVLTLPVMEVPAQLGSRVLYRAFASTVFAGGSYTVRNSDGLYDDLYTEYDELADGALAADRDRVYTVGEGAMLDADDIIFYAEEPETPDVPGSDPTETPLGNPVDTAEIPLGTPGTGDGSSAVFAVLAAGAAVALMAIARRKRNAE